MTPEPAHPSDTRERIVRTAMDMFAYDGYGPTGLAQIARKAGVNAGSIYHFFPSKEDLLGATLERRLELLGPEVLDPIWDRIDDPIERVWGLMDGYRRMLQVTDFAHGCPIGNLALEVGESLPRTRELIRANFDNWRRHVAGCFRDAGDRLPGDADHDALALFVLTTMEGAVMLARTERSFAPFDSAIASLRDYIDRMLESGTSWKPSRASGRRRKSKRS